MTRQPSFTNPSADVLAILAQFQQPQDGRQSSRDGQVGTNIDTSSTAPLIPCHQGNAPDQCGFEGEQIRAELTGPGRQQQA